MDSGFGDAQLFAAVHLLFFLDRAIAQRSGFHRERAAMRALELPFVLQKFEIFANRDLRRTELAGKRADKHAPFGLEHFENFAAAFFAKHGWEYASSLKSRSSQDPNLDLIAEALDVVQTNATGKIGQDIRGAASNREP